MSKFFEDARARYAEVKADRTAKEQLAKEQVVDVNRALTALIVAKLLKLGLDPAEGEMKQDIDKGLVTVEGVTFGLDAANYYHRRPQTVGDVRDINYNLAIYAPCPNCGELYPALFNVDAAWKIAEWQDNPSAFGVRYHEHTITPMLREQVNPVLTPAEQLQSAIVAIFDEYGVHRD